MSQIKEVKDATDIVEIIGERLSLKNAGANYKGVCPFHTEKSPSFFVSSSLQRYKCFGCGVGGDVLNFLEAYEGMPFSEALKILADRAGIKLKLEHRTKDDEEREVLLSILELSKEYYHYILTKHSSGKIANEYLKKRAVSNETTSLFKIGYALPQWDGLINYLNKKKKYKLSDILRTGLVVRNRSGRYYDRFRGRIVFPLKNHRGQVVGFSGRLLDKNPKEAKYINTPETELYHKSKMLYGYSELFSEIKKKSEVIVCEGEFDVLSSSQHHVNNIVAIKGSALTAEQVKLLQRVATKVILCLDADDAGIKATKRAIEVMRDSNLELRVIELTDPAEDKVYKDADELISEDPKLWRQKIKSSLSVYDYLINRSTEAHDIQKPSGQKAIINELAPILSQITYAVEKEFYLKKLSKTLNIRQNLVENDINRISEKKNIQQKISRSKDKNKQQKQIVDKNLHLEELERYVVYLFFHLPDDECVKKLPILKEIDWTLGFINTILDRLGSFKPKYSFDKFARTLPEDLKEVLMEWYFDEKFAKNIKKNNVVNEFKKILARLRQASIKNEVAKLNKEIEKLDRGLNKNEADEEKLSLLLSKLAGLQKKMQ